LNLLPGCSAALWKSSGRFTIRRKEFKVVVETCAVDCLCTFDAADIVQDQRSSRDENSPRLPLYPRVKGKLRTEVSILNLGLSLVLFCFLNSFIDNNMPTTREQRPSIVYGPRAPVPLTLTFGQLLDHHVEVRPNSPAVISHVQGRTISFRQLRDRSINLAKAMTEAGIGKGSLVGIISGTRYEYLEVNLSFEFSGPPSLI
jgi:AMP-binding enzyme